jgi:hypothetical protein
MFPTGPGEPTCTTREAIFHSFLSLRRPSSGRALSQLARLFRRRHGDLNVWNKHSGDPGKHPSLQEHRVALNIDARHFLPTT